MLYGFLVVICFLLCVLFLGKVLRALIHVFSKKGKRFIQNLRKRKSLQKTKAKKPINEAASSQNNEESIRRRKGDAIRSPEKHGRDLVRTSHQDDTSSKDN